MKIYYGSGSDGGSDNGYFEIIVRGKDKREARKLINNHLRNMNREDLIPEVSIQLIGDTPIIHTTVES